MNYYLGVDGGGTKTVFYLSNELGEILDCFETTTCHIEQVGEDGIKNVFQKFLERHCNKKIKFSALGIPGFGEIDNWDLTINNIMSNIFKKNYICLNDVKVGWAGSLLCSPGINIVAGTGSIAYGEDEKGNSLRSGGWGHFLGDEASAYWIGKKTLEIFCKESDSRLPKTPLYNLIKSHLSLEKDQEIIDHVHNKLKFSRTEIAKFSKITYDAALLKDSEAIKIFDEVAKELAILSLSIINNLDFKNAIKISYSGGVFNSGDLVLKPLQDELDKFNINYTLVKPELNPGLGALLYALKQDGVSINDQIINNLKSYKKI